MFRDRDFGLRERETDSAAELTQDLELDTLLHAMAGDDAFLLEVAMKSSVAKFTRARAHPLSPTDPCRLPRMLRRCPRDLRDRCRGDRAREESLGLDVLEVSGEHVTPFH